MKSRTSFFNTAVLKKDILRFSPVWILYSIFLFLIFSVLDLSSPARTGSDVADFMQAMVWFNLLYGGICANILFGDLFGSRMCNALHTMPMRREGWFLTHLSAGLLFSFVPNLLGSIVLCVMLGKYYYLALLWLAIMTLQFLFFFGTGIFSVMCAGSRLGMAAVYFIINFISLLGYVMADQLYEPLLYGIRIESDLFQFFCPTLQAAHAYVNFYYDKIMGGVFKGLYWDTWYYLFGMAGVGMLAVAGAVLLYRRRQLECAGDFLALRPLKPVFLVICTLGAGVVLYAFTLLFGLSGSYTFMLIGIVAGFFIGKMLLERTIKVFRPKAFLGFAVLAVILIGSLVVTKLDPLGITRYVPETDEIEFMRFYRDNDSHRYNDPIDTDRITYQFETPEQIDRFRQIHTVLQSERDHKDGEVCQVEVMYRLKDGSTVMRYYDVGTNSAVFEDLRSYFSTPEYVFCTEDVERYIEAINFVEMDLHYDFYRLKDDGRNQAVVSDPKVIHGLMQAILTDCETGNMAQDYTFHRFEDSVLWMFIDVPAINMITVDGNTYKEGVSALDSLQIFESCENTIAFIEDYLKDNNLIA